ncbi:MAG: regulatory protein FmdB family [Gemmatimonadetes bacterium]|nr:regulatory protein FmdB family [Gemmatimonadota bacterium]
MPTYEYRCPDGHEFEKFWRSISSAQPDVPCPVCGKLGERQLSASGFAFKGSGFYLTDYGKNAHRGTGTPTGTSPASEGASAKGEKSGGEGKSGEGSSTSEGSSKSDSSSKSEGKSGGESTAPAAKPAESAPKPAASPKPAKGGSDS